MDGRQLFVMMDEDACAPDLKHPAETRRTLQVIQSVLRAHVSHPTHHHYIQFNHRNNNVPNNACVHAQ
jgi:hypothetical protein